MRARSLDQVFDRDRCRFLGDKVVGNSGRPASDPNLRSEGYSTRVVLASFASILCLRIAFYSQTGNSAKGDEGVSLLTAQLINSGSGPYFDFFCDQPPFYFYLLAGWMRLFGDTWRSAHSLSALLSGGCVALAAAYVFTRLEGSPWRLPVSLFVAAAIGLNPLFTTYGIIGQSYALLMFLSVATLWLTVMSLKRPAFFSSFPGLVTGAMLSASLLTIPIAPALIWWAHAHGTVKDRWERTAWYAVGIGIPFLPLVPLVVRGGRYIAYNVVLFHLLYRDTSGWASVDVTGWNLKVVASWISSVPNLGIALLALAGCLFPASAPTKGEQRLCGGIAAALGLYLALPRPTFVQYFVLLIPFLAVGASLAANAYLSHLRLDPRWHWSALLVVGFGVLWLARFRSYNRWESLTSGEWCDVETIAAQINSVTAAGAPVYASHDSLYFAARRRPPPGLENSFERAKVPLTAARYLHFTSPEEVNRRLMEGRYETVAVLADGEEVRTLSLASIYREHRSLSGYVIFWDRRPGPRSRVALP